MRNLLLISIFVIGFLLRFLYLDSIPPSLTWDEAAWGYNAYAFSIDLKDEFGRFLPHDYLESFGDFKPPIYAYLSIVPVMFFGLNEFSTRFVSAFFGSITVLLSYFLVKGLFYNLDGRHKLALITSLFVAISPWNILLSRAAFEANVSTFFIISGITFFLYGIKSKKIYVFISLFLFSLSVYTFNSTRIVAPLLLLVLCLKFYRIFLRDKKFLFQFLFLGLVMVMPVIPFLFSPQASLRYKEVNIFSDINLIKRSNDQIENAGSSFISKIIYNRRAIYAVEYISHYLDNISPGFLFVKGDGNPKFSTQDVGQMYLWEYPFLVLGILFLIRDKKGYWWIVPIWLLVSIMPAATARETPHALRIASGLPTFQILVAYGVFSLFIYIKRNKRIFYSIFIFCVLLNFLYFIHIYKNHYKFDFSGEWQYGYKDSISYVSSVKDNYDSIYITTSLGRPYIYYLFYTKTNPENFRKNAKVRRDSFGFVTVDSFDKYRFMDDPNNISPSKRNLIINTPAQVPQNSRIKKYFYKLDGSVSLVAYEI